MLRHRRWWPPEELHQALSAEILRRAAAQPGLPSWNRGGWRSSNDLLDWRLPAVRALRGFVQRSLELVHGAPLTIDAAWALVNRRGSYHERHAHSATWSAVYYVTGGAPTIFEIDGAEVATEPEPGLLVMFPSATWHRSAPSLGEEPRITLAFDAR